MFYVYVLQCSNQSLYVGYSTDLKKRVNSHKNGKVISTRYRLPINLIYYECFIDKKDAKSREIYFKSGSGKEQLNKILQNTFKN